MPRARRVPSYVVGSVEDVKRAAGRRALVTLEDFFGVPLDGRRTSHRLRMLLLCQQAYGLLQKRNVPVRGAAADDAVWMVVSVEHLRDAFERCGSNEFPPSSLWLRALSITFMRVGDGQYRGK